METTKPSLPEIKPSRPITGMSAILLPFKADGSVDWAGFEAHVGRTSAAGLTPAVNMDTGFANLIDEATRMEALRRTRAVLAGKPIIAGAFVGDLPGDAFDMATYGTQIEQIQSHEGTPIIFQSHGLTGGMHWLPTMKSQAPAITFSPSSSDRCSLPSVPSTTSKPMLA